MRFFCEWSHKWRTFRPPWPTLPGPGRQPLGGSISLKFLLETRLQSEFFDTLDDLLGFRVQKLWCKWSNKSREVCSSSRTSSSLSKSYVFTNESLSFLGEMLNMRYTPCFCAVAARRNFSALYRDLASPLFLQFPSASDPMLSHSTIAWKRFEKVGTFLQLRVFFQMHSGRL